MTAVAVALVLVAVLLAVGWGVERRRGDLCVKSRLRDQVIVTLKGGGSFAGVLLESDQKSLLLCQAVEVTENVPVDGELLVRWADVAYVQKP